MAEPTPVSPQCRRRAGCPKTRASSGHKAKDRNAEFVRQAEQLVPSTLFRAHAKSRQQTGVCVQSDNVVGMAAHLDLSSRE